MGDVQVVVVVDAVEHPGGFFYPSHKTVLVSKRKECFDQPS